MKVLKETWLKDEPSVNLLYYVSNLRQRVLDACEVAWKNLKHSQTKMKTWYEKRVKKRQFKVGDEVLALLSIPNHPLHARYHGPYVIAKKVSEVDYVEYTRTTQGTGFAT